MQLWRSKRYGAVCSIWDGGRFHERSDGYLMESITRVL